MALTPELDKDSRRVADTRVMPATPRHRLAVAIGWAVYVVVTVALVFTLVAGPRRVSALLVVFVLAWPYFTGKRLGRSLMTALTGRPTKTDAEEREAERERQTRQDIARLR